MGEGRKQLDAVGYESIAKPKASPERQRREDAERNFRR